MPSPFPGMNPYLEQEEVWHDFHDRFLPLIAEMLNQQAGPAYIVKIDEHVYVHGLNEGERTFLGRADTTVSRLTTSSQAQSALGLLEAPARVHLVALDIERETFVEIRDRRNRQLITAIELLSPSNKTPGRFRQQYEAKRDQLLVSQAHFVELDLLRGGPRMPFADLPPCDYYALVSRVEQRRIAEIWPVWLRDPLPTIPIPLRAPDSDLRLDMQEVLHRVYDAAGYLKYIYEGSPVPPLAAEDQAWARQVVRESGANGSLS